MGETTKIAASNGYVIVYVGKSHHLADVRGYAYGHRIVAEQVIGRKLVPGEIVHHRDKNKTNNSPGNLHVCESIAEHLLQHRKRNDLQMPGERNDKCECKCGCGAVFSKFDESGRPRQYVSGHNRPASPLADAIISRLLSLGPTRTRSLADTSSAGVKSVKCCLTRLAAAGLVKRVRHGMWSATQENGYGA